MTHPDETRLNDYVDGRLDAGDAAGVEAHLAACGECRDRVAAIRALSARLGALPRGIRPRRDLRPRPEDAAIGPGAPPAGGEPPAGPGRADRAPWRAWVRDAAVIAALLAAGVGLWYGLPGRDGPPTSADPVAPVLSAYVRASDDLAAAVRARGAGLGPAAARALRSSLTSVEGSIRELERARAEAGADTAALTRALESRYRTRLELLRDALDLLEES